MPKVLKIVTAPNTILGTPAKKVEYFDAWLKNLVKDMQKTLEAQKDPQGVGLAAPQVGVNLALFIIKPSPQAKTEVFVNPRIVNSLKSVSDKEKSRLKFSDKQSRKPTNHHLQTDSKSKEKRLEGCLSVPKIWSPILRAEKVLLEYQDLEGIRHKKWISGFKAIIIQHEIDHLQGILFTQRAIEQNSQLYEEKEGKLKKLKF